MRVHKGTWNDSPRYRYLCVRSKLIPRKPNECRDSRFNCEEKQYEDDFKRDVRRQKEKNEETEPET